MICGLCGADIPENESFHDGVHEPDCGRAKRGYCVCELLTVHARCCPECKTDDPACVPSTPVVVTRRGNALPEPLASEEAAS